MKFPLEQFDILTIKILSFCNFDLVLKAGYDMNILTREEKILALFNKDPFYYTCIGDWVYPDYYSNLAVKYKESIKYLEDLKHLED